MKGGLAAKRRYAREQKAAERKRARAAGGCSRCLRPLELERRDRGLVTCSACVEEQRRRRAARLCIRPVRYGTVPYPWRIDCWPLYRGGGQWYVVHADHGGAYGAFWMNPESRGHKWFRTSEKAQAFADKLNKKPRPSE